MTQSETPRDDYSDTTGEDDRGHQGEVIRAQLTVRPDLAANCAVIQDGREISQVTHDLKQNRTSVGPGGGDNACECHTAITYSEGGEESREYRTSATNPNCICPVFNEYDCIPTIKSVDGRSITVGIAVPTRSELRDLLDGLDHVGADVTVDWLVTGDSADVTKEIDISTLTAKQREALETAFAAGYYDRPRGAALGTLAARLDISKSAVSQRLNAAEAKLVKAVLETGGSQIDTDR